MRGAADQQDLLCSLFSRKCTLDLASIKIIQNQCCDVLNVRLWKVCVNPGHFNGTQWSGLTGTRSVKKGLLSRE